MVRHAPCLKTQKQEMPPLKCMPLIHNLLYGFATFTTQTRLDLDLTRVILSKTDLGWRSYGSSKLLPSIRNVVFLHSAHLGVKAWSHRSDYQSNYSSHDIFIVKDRPLYLNFSIPPCENSSISLEFYRSYKGKNCIDMFLTHLGTRMWRASYQIFYPKWFFWSSRVEAC